MVRLFFLLAVLVLYIDHINCWSKSEKLHTNFMSNEISKNYKFSEGNNNLLEQLYSKLKIDYLKNKITNKKIYYLFSKQFENVKIKKAACGTSKGKLTK